MNRIRIGTSMLIIRGSRRNCVKCAATIFSSYPLKMSKLSSSKTSISTYTIATMKARALQWRLIATLLLLCYSNLTSASSPTVDQTRFDSVPTAPIYFASSETLLLHDRDEGIVWRSTDAGSTWTECDDVPKGAQVAMLQHPYDNQKAYLLSLGIEHWYTNDQGASWHAFETAYPQSSFRLPLSFHAGDSNKVLFHAMECSSMYSCEEVVGLSFAKTTGRVTDQG